MASNSNKSKSANPQLEEKLQDIKRLQSNWMRERKEHQEKGVLKETKDEQHKGRPKKRNEPIKKKEPDTISWIVNSGPKPKKKMATSLRSRSASPSTRTSNTKSSKSTEMGRDSDRRERSFGTGAHSRPSSGSSRPSSRPSSGSKNSASSRPPSGKSVLSSRSNYENKDNEESPILSEPLIHQSEPHLHKLVPQINKNKDDLNCVEDTEFNTEQIQYSNSDMTLLDKRSRVGQSQLVQSISLLDDDMFNRLADQVADRVKSELRFERQNVGEKQSILDDNDPVLSHQCTKCKQLMVPPDHTPTLLVPCGHTFCEACSEDRIKCPSCRTKVNSTAINAALEQVICQVYSSRLHNNDITKSHQQNTINSYNPSRYINHPKMSSESTNHRQHAVRLPASDGGGRRQIVHSPVIDVDNEDQGKFYQDQFDGLVIRCEALRNEEDEIEHGLDELQTDYEKEKKVLGNIEKEEQRIAEEIRKFEEKLQLLNNHKEEYERRCNDLEKQKNQESDRLNIVKETLRNHLQHMEKVKMLARNFNISIE